MSKLYIIPNFTCNLNCPHCELHLRKDDFNENSFYKAFSETNFSENVLFGGEPLLYEDRYLKLINSNKITSISTNLLLLDENIIKILKQKEISIATSWNLQRFTDKQYTLWLNNLKLLEKYDMKCIVLITMTKDLIDLEISSFLKYLYEWNNYNAIEGILFEHLIDYNIKNDLHIQADEWLCKIDKEWKFKFKNIIKDRVLNWNCDCDNIFTLYPNGELKRGCPQNEKEFVLKECLTCKLAGKCKPCKLQHVCSFPKKLYERVINE